ncbi:hypothetical protein MMB68_23800 [Priestia sp. Y58]|uniref:hypothetical protein n=1 Tax=Priestia TaxID=2800373 RepID=UPI00222078BE|nr:MULTISPECIES: hypothetical protein [Priestia]MCZ8496160.1 hypothetical protein [Priestia megaterium]MDG0032576.1 hypothetical protein [Priestia sp. Y58]MDG0061887.1 hypothetical protein [Priestia sp. P5]UYV53521.1 hypothetical protein OHU65_02650 [Priestia megaterium]
MSRKLGVLILLALAIVFSGCSKEEGNVPLKELEKIHINVIKEQKMKQGISYEMELVNKSDLTIKQNNVFLSYPLKMKNGYSENKFKVLAEGNKLNIKPKQKVQLTVFLPYKGINKEALAIDEPDVKCIGYWNKLDDYHQFSFGGSLKQE